MLVADAAPATQRCHATGTTLSEQELNVVRDRLSRYEAAPAFGHRDKAAGTNESVDLTATQIQQDYCLRN